ncbi:hypothetical protein CN297_17310 [Bacillus cereus]|nr:hypothetical protein CN297_17310 [Bacillus cereus]
MQIFKEPQWIFRKKKKSHVKLNVYNFSLMGMWRYPITIKLKFYNAPQNEKLESFIAMKFIFIVFGATCAVRLMDVWCDPIYKSLQ